MKPVDPAREEGTGPRARPLLRMPLWLVAALVAMRLAMVAAYPWLAARVPEWGWANNDGYDDIAIQWLETGTFSLQPGVPTALRLPLYPALIAAARVVAGPAHPGLVMLLQAALSVGTGLLLFRMTTGLFGRRAGMAAAVLFLLHPQINNFVFRCATETLFLFLVVALAHESVLFLRTRRLRHLLLAAAALGLSLLTRQTLLPLAWLAGIVLLAWIACGRRMWPRRLVWAGLAAGMVVLLLAPWVVRNRRHTRGEWVLQTWTGQPLCQGLYVTRHLDEFFARRKTLTELDQDCMAEIAMLQRRLRREWPSDMPPMAREAAADRFFRQRAVHLLARSPAGNARRILRNLLWAPVLQMTWRSTAILMVVNWPILLLGLWGGVRAARESRRVRIEVLPLLVLFAYLYISHAATWPQARYILPGLVPFLALAGNGLDHLSRRRRLPPAPAGEGPAAESDPPA